VRGLVLRARIAAGFAVVIAVALAIDVWLRLCLLVYRDEPRRVAAFGRGMRAWGDVLFGCARWAVGLDVSIEGSVPASGRYLVVANHQSSLDIPFLITTLRALELKFVAMESLRRGKPVISMMIRHGGLVCVGKTNVGEDLAALTRFAADLERFGGSPVIFPAGGLERNHGARRFYFAGIEVLRRGSKLPILPVAISGLAKAPSIGGLALLEGAKVTMRIAPPLSYDEVGRDPRAVYEALERTIYGRA